jgi:transcriptional regulator with XRE-family HTH domain
MSSQNATNKGALALRKARAAKHLTQSDVGRLVGRSAAQVSLWESGRNVPNARILALLEKTFGVKAALWGQVAREAQ